MEKTKLKLFIGDKHLSSWSMRPWLLMKYFEIPFEEVLVRLDQKATKEEIAKISPTGRIPVLVDGDHLVWDSLSICEYLAEKFPRLKIWPESIKQRSIARSLCAEMHSSFTNLRKECSMDLLGTRSKVLTASAQEEVKRIETLFSECIIAHKPKGPYLMGEFTAVDAFYMPVVSRFRSYQVDLKKSEAKEYCKFIEETELFQMWLKEAKEGL